MEKEILKAYQILKNTGIELGGGNCGNAAFAVLMYLKGKKLYPGISYVTNAESDNDLLNGEPDIYHVVISDKGKYYDEMGIVTVKDLENLAKNQYGVLPNILAYEFKGAEKIHERIIRNNTNWGINWKYFYNVLEKANRIEESTEQKVNIPEDSKPITLHLIRRNVKAANHGGRFGQDIEPHGRYWVEASPEACKGIRERNPEIPYQEADITFKKPLVIFGDRSNARGWKEELVKKYGRKGKELSKHLAKLGYDGIITHDKYGLSEIVEIGMFQESVQQKLLKLFLKS